MAVDTWDLEGLTPEQYAEKYNSPHAVQPEQTPQRPGLFRRYGEAALGGVATAAPFAALEAATGIGSVGAPATLALGGLGGIASQAAEDIFPGTWWAGPVAGTVAGFGVSGLRQPLQAGARYVWTHSPLAGAGAFGVGEAVAHAIINGGTTLSNLAQHAPEAIAAATAIPLYQGVRGLVRHPEVLRNWLYPAAGGIGGAQGDIPNAPWRDNQLMPTPGL